MLRIEVIGDLILKDTTLNDAVVITNLMFNHFAG